MERIRKHIENTSLAARIRYAFILLLVPIVLFDIFCFASLWAVNNSYKGMVDSAARAGGFSLDFKKDFDYETYLLIVGNKTKEDTRLKEILEEAGIVLNSLKKNSTSADNYRRLESIGKYLDNLDIYTDRIIENMDKEDKYEDNIRIWENDVQIVTSLVHNTITEYMYYEVKSIQEGREKYYELFGNILKVSIAAMVLVVIYVILVSVYLPKSITKPLVSLTKVADRVAGGDFSVKASEEGSAELRKLDRSFNEMIDKIDELIGQVTTEQIRLRKAEFELLQSQINPHFLYNTLDAIVWLAEAGEHKQVVSMVRSLSEFFRTSLNQGKDIITIKEELNHVGSYLQIQKVRYEDILNYSIDVPEELYENHIPKITLQPLVENALYHGIKNKRGSGNISITGEMLEDGFIITVEDDGRGMDAERLELVRDRLSHKSENTDAVFGLYNVNERIRLNFGERYGITVYSGYDEGTVVTVYLPVINEQ